MITLSTSGSSIVFEFSGNSTYLNDGTITVPQNSLALIVDESDMVSFKKANSNDLFVSANISEFGMTKDELISWYETNMVGSTGGGGVTSGEVQSMIDASVADYFDGVEYDSGTTRINFYHGNTVKAYIDASDFVIDGMIDDVRIETISGTSYLVIDFNTESGKEDIQIPLTDIFNPDNYYTKSETSGATEIATAIDEKANKSSAVGSYEFGATNQVNCIRFKMVSGPQILNDIYFPKINGKGILTSNNTWAKNNYDFQLVESTAVTTSVTSASTDSQVPSAKAVYDALGSAGGGVTSGEVQTMIDESISGKTDETTFTAYTAATDTVLSNKQTTLTAGTGINITDNVISATGGGGFDTDTERLLSTALVDLNDRKADKTLLSGYQKKGDYATKSQLDAKANASEVMTLDKSKENELITAAALNSINERLIALETAVQTLQTLHNNE